MNLNRELHEALGYCWHEPILGSQIWLITSNRMSFICSKCGERYTEDFCPDYVAEPWLVIREMEKRGCLDKFILFVWDKDIPPEYDGGLMHIDTCMEIVKLIAIDTTGKIARVALDWLQKEAAR